MDEVNNKIGGKHSVTEEGKEHMISLLNAASAITAENSPDVVSANLHNDGAHDPVNKAMAHDLDEDVPMTFPQRLMEILSNEEHADIISWLPHGKGFIIYKKKKFAADVLPLYFKQSKFTSFTRKLNRWGFTRVTRGPETGAYYHKFFQRGELRLCMQMSCQSVKPSQNQHLSVVYGLGAKNPLLPTSSPGFVGQNPADLAQQNQSLIRHQLQQLQLQQLQLQQLQLQQQQQLQAAELLRHALSKQNGGENGNDPSNLPNDPSGPTSMNNGPSVGNGIFNPMQQDQFLGMKGDANSLFLQTLQRTKESGSGLMGSQPIALLPALQSSNATLTQQPSNPNADMSGQRGPWAA